MANDEQGHLDLLVSHEEEKVTGGHVSAADVDVREEDDTCRAESATAGADGLLMGCLMKHS